MLWALDPAYAVAFFMHNGLPGFVVLECRIDREGRVAEVKVLRPEKLGMTEAAVEAVRQWRFEPCMVDDRPVVAQFVLTVRFNLPR